ncbi:hypothetical protein ACQPWY_25800 [Pseudonocardia xinjiangensis]|uniref:hypothetical protein n=1 Tax=Pseudonocardia xinjiangensis TaxID=75289 RepID=UPI003D8F0E83
MSDRLERLQDVLLIQCPQKDAYAAVKLAERPGAGVVVTTANRSDVWALAPVADGRPLLFDASRYAGKRRRLASGPFDRSWLAAQREAEVPVLTDSGYVAEGDEAGLVSVLQRAADLGDVIATLALHSWWLNRAGGLDRLLGHVQAAGVPIALALEHSGDPLGVGRTLRGMIALLGVGVPRDPTALRRVRARVALPRRLGRRGGHPH